MGSERLLGKSWLIATTVIWFVTLLSSTAITLIREYGEVTEVQQLYAWYGLIRMVGLFGTACFAIFLFINWSSSRMNLDMKSLLFSYSGRIPRSVFWITICILAPLGWALSIIPYTTNADGLLEILILTVNFCYAILGIWVTFAIYAKRWHDCSKSGWMTLVAFIPIIGALWVIGYLGFVRGSDGPNQYGDNPLTTQKA